MQVLQPDLLYSFFDLLLALQQIAGLPLDLCYSYPDFPTHPACGENVGLLRSLGLSVKEKCMAEMLALIVVLSLTIRLLDRLR